MNHLDSKMSFSLMAAEKDKIATQMKRWPERWENTSHFIRSALIVFHRQVDREYLDLSYQKDRMRKMNKASYVKGGL